MKVLITGSTGFLGLTIKESLKSEYIFDLNRTNGSYICKLEHEVPKFLDRFDLVIHAAGKAHSVPKTEVEKKQFYDVNHLGTLNLLQGLQNSALPKEFVFISSVAVYGQEAGYGINETFPLEAKDPYGLSKIKAEESIQDWCIKHGVICTILRLPLLVGKKPPGNLGAMIKAIEKGYYFNVAKGKARKSMVLCKDVASFIPAVAKVGGVYNLTDGYHPNFFELSRALSDKNILNLPLFFAKILGRLGDFLGDKSPINSSKIKKINSDLIFDDSKARKLLNWHPELVLSFIKKEGVK